MRFSSDACRWVRMGKDTLLDLVEVDAIEAESESGGPTGGACLSIAWSLQLRQDAPSVRRQCQKESTAGLIMVTPSESVLCQQKAELHALTPTRGPPEASLQISTNGIDASTEA